MGELYKMSYFIAISIALATLPFLRSLGFWAFMWQKKEYRFDLFWNFIRTPEGRRAIFGTFYFLELFLLLLILLFSRSAFYILWIGLALESAMVITKIYKNQFRLPVFTGRMTLTLTQVFLSQGMAVFLLLSILTTPVLIVALILSINLFLFLVILLNKPFLMMVRLMIFKKAGKARQKVKKAKFIGITGSYGKTSVKEFIARILNEKFKAGSTPLHVNTELGVANYLIKNLKEKIDFFVIEMGAYKRGEISLLGKMVDQEVAFLTGINQAHEAIFGGVENTIKAKSEIIEPLVKKKGTLYINADCENCKKVEIPEAVKTIRYGIKNRKNADAFSDNLEFLDDKVKFDFCYKDKKESFTTKLLGKHNVLNLTGVIALAFDLGLSAEEVQKGLDKIKPLAQTMEVIKNGQMILVDDSYNCNPDSVLTACESLEVFKDKKKILVLDDILELGRETKKVHQEMGAKLADFDFDKIFLVGINYADLVKKGLIKAEFPKENILKNIGKLKKQKNTVILFEGRKAGKFVGKFK